MDETTYLFCLIYHYNHFITRDKDISKYVPLYQTILYGGNQMSGKSFKMIYTQYKDEALKKLEENIVYCENEMKKEVGKKLTNPPLLNNKQNRRKYKVPTLLSIEYPNSTF